MEFYHQQIKDNKINAGYACDDLSGVLFKNGQLVEAVSQNDINNSYYVTLKNRTIRATKLKSKILINKDALPVTAYNTLDINKTLKDFPEIYNQETPLNAFISIKYALVNGRESKLNQLSSYYFKDRLSDTVPDIKVDEKRKIKIVGSSI